MLCDNVGLECCFVPVPVKFSEWAELHLDLFSEDELPTTLFVITCRQQCNGIPLSSLYSKSPQIPQFQESCASQNCPLLNRPINDFKELH